MLQYTTLLRGGTVSRKHTYVVRSPSGSAIKLDGIREAILLEFPHISVMVKGIPVELQRTGHVNAQPVGRKLTLFYARLREDALQKKNRGKWDLDIAIESGAIKGNDVALILFTLPSGRELVVPSEKVIMPPQFMRIAKKRGFDTTKVGDVIHEHFPHIPSGDWHAYAESLARGDTHPVKSGPSRKELITSAVRQGLRKLKPFA